MNVEMSVSKSYEPRPFADGIHGVLLVDWLLRCETPLAIRNGAALQYRDYTRQGTKKSKKNNEKSRWNRPVLDWRTAAEDEFHVTALHYGYEVVDGRVETYHCVPASTVRGALRSWTIRSLVAAAYRNASMPDIDNVPEALACRDNGYQLLASLFGTAFDSRDDSELYSNAGRLQVESARFEGAGLRDIDVSGVTMPVDDDAGPDNVRRQLTVRNPLDRMTHASKENGLHQFLEFCRHETFRVRLSIRNPMGSDLGLLHLWAREINDGLLRFGALASIGRGRVRIVEESYEIWQRPMQVAPPIAELIPFQPADELSDEVADDALAGLWACYPISKEVLAECEAYLLEHVQDGQTT